MSLIDNPNVIAPESLIPTVESDVFELNKDASFWLGITAARGVTIMPNETIGAQQLRANVYIDEFAFLGEESRQLDGTEVDQDDDRATHFTVLANGASSARPTVVGTARLINKTDVSKPLPVEHLFPDAFDEPAALNSVEASRFIARHPNRQTQKTISLSLIRAMALHAYKGGLEPAYAVVEEHLMRDFTKIGMPFTQIAEKRMIPEYSTENMAIRIEPKEILKQVKADKRMEKLLTWCFTPQVVELNGLGHFDGTLLNALPVDAPKN